MKCKLIFYAAHKTSFCEKALQKSFSELNLEISRACFATDNEGLGTFIVDAFEKHNIVFVVGGLCFDDDKGIVSIISRALANTSVDEYKKLKNDDGDDGYVIKAQSQLLILLPDEPDQIENIMQGPVSGYIRVNAKDAP